MTLIPRSYLWDVDNVFEKFMPTLRNAQSAEASVFNPTVDIIEQDNAYLIKTDLPGVKKEDIHVTIDGGVLSIEAEHKSEKEEKSKGKVIRSERRYGKFMRSFTVGENIHEKDIHAAFEDGVLKLTLPKVEERTPESRRIKVK